MGKLGDVWNLGSFEIINAEDKIDRGNPRGKFADLDLIERLQSWQLAPRLFRAHMQSASQGPFAQVGTDMRVNLAL